MRRATWLWLLLLVAPAGDTQAAAPDWSFSWYPKLEVASPDRAHTLRLGGRFLWDGALVRYDAGLVNLSSSPGWNTEHDVRQARIFLLGRVFRHLELKGEVDFAPEDPTLADAYLGWRALGPLGIVRFGHQKLPFSLEQQTSRRYLLFMERSLANALDPGVRDIGLTFRNAHLDEHLHWAVGGFRETLPTGYEFDGPAQYSVSGRVTGLPIWEEEGRQLLHLGASFEYEFVNDASFSIAKSPESFLADRLLDTGPIDGVDGQIRVGGEIAWNRGPLVLQAEYVFTYLDRDAGTGDASFSGFYVQGGWFVTGEHRAYSKAEARFSRVTPRRNFDPLHGGWGALQLALRVSYLNLVDGDLRGGIQTDTTVGVNWHPFPFLRLSFNWVHGWIENQGDVDVVQGRFQFEY